MKNRDNKSLTTDDDLEILIGWLRGLPLGGMFWGWGSSSSKEGKRGVSGGVNSLYHKQSTHYNNI